MLLKKRLIRNICIAVAGILLLIGLYVFVIMWEPSADDNLSDGASSNIEYIVSERAENVTQFHIKNSYDEYDIIKATNENGEVIYSIPSITTGDTDIGKVKSAASNLCNIISDRRITNKSSDLSAYGIDAALSNVTIYKNDGTETKLFIGDQTPDGYQYYCTSDKKDGIYTVDSRIYEIIFAKSDYYRINEVLNIADVSVVDKVQLYKNNSPVLSIRTATEQENSGKVVAASWMMEYPYQSELANDKTSELMQKLSVIKASGFPQNTSDLKYEYRIEITTDYAYYSFDISRKSENGVIYVKNNASDIVYTVAPELYDILSGINPNDYISKFVCLYNISDVDSVTINAENIQYTMEVGNDSGKAYKLNNSEVDKKIFSKAYQKLIALSFAEIFEYSPSGTPYMTILFDFTSGDDISIAFYQIDDRYYAAVKSDGTTLKVLKSEVDKIAKMTNEQ